MRNVHALYSILQRTRCQDPCPPPRAPRTGPRFRGRLKQAVEFLACVRATQLGRLRSLVTVRFGPGKPACSGGCRNAINARLRGGNPDRLEECRCPNECTPPMEAAGVDLYPRAKRADNILIRQRSETPGSFFPVLVVAPDEKGRVEGHYRKDRARAADGRFTGSQAGPAAKAP